MTKIQKFKRIATMMVQGKSPKQTNTPFGEAVVHHKLGLLAWQLDNGNVVVCRTYYEYQRNVEASNNKDDNQ